MEQQVGIYKIENQINHKIYIGQSIDIQYRFYQHQHSKDDYYIHKAIRKYEVDNFTFEILELNLYNPKMRNDREIYWIQYYNSLVPNGYNLTKGGNNIAEIIKKPVKQYSLSGDYLATYESQSEAGKKNNIPSSNISLVCNYINNTAGGYIWRFVDDYNIVKPYSVGKTICQYSLKGEYIQTFDNAAIASKILHIDRANISGVCSKRLKTAGGFIWRYEDDTTPIKPIKSKNKKVQQYTIDNNSFIAEYPSISAAARHFNIAPSNMSVGINKNNHIYKGYYWKIVEDDYE